MEQVEDGLGASLVRNYRFSTNPQRVLGKNYFKQGTGVPVIVQTGEGQLIRSA